jgi:ribonuclease-3
MGRAAGAQRFTAAAEPARGGRARRSSERFLMVEDACLDALAVALGHRFERRELLLEAVTHRSFANEQPRLARGDNERLEFLGDAVIGAVVASLVWETFPEATEGELTRRRADLVCAEALADLARGLGVGEALRLGKGEARSGGREKPRLLASALEACVGAVWVDADPATAFEVGRALFAPLLHRELPGTRDYKSRIQELVQRRAGRTPRYRLIETAGPDHERTFTVELLVDDAPVALGVGRSKADAEQEAARVALERYDGGESAAAEGT